MKILKNPPVHIVALASVISACLLLYWPVLVALVANWERDDNYSHGFIVPPVAAYLAWVRRDRLRNTERRPATAGLFIILVSLGVLSIGTAGVEFFLMRTSLIGVLAGTIVFLAGWRWLRILLFPLAFLLLMIPLPAIVFYQIAFPLQLLATRFGVSVLELAQIPVLREGNVIMLSRTTLEVVEACSGIRSIMSLFALAVLYGYLWTPRLGLRGVIALSALPIAVIANGFRVAGTGIAAHFITSLAMLFLVSGTLKALPAGFPVRRPRFPQS
jgi:exosortase